MISSLGSVTPPFVNETIVTGTEVRISWLIEDTHLNITSFRIYYEALDHQESVTRVLDGSLRSVTLRHLYPLTKYSFLMVTIADSGLFSNASESVEFTTTADPGKISSPLPQLLLADIHVRIRQNIVMIRKLFLNC